MKALLISDDQNVITKLDSFLQGINFNTIIYRWLLKALDNVEEIRPDLIIVSTNEYPRHWKTLVQFVKSGIGGDKIAVFLYEPNTLSLEDQEKSKLLGINGCFNSLSDEELLKLQNDIYSFFNINTISSASIEGVTDDSEESIPTVESINITNNDDQNLSAVKGTGLFILTNPKINKLVNGKYFDYNGSKITLDISCSKNTEGLDKNTEIEVLTFFDDDICKSCTAKVQEKLSINDSSLLVLNIGNFYEEK